MLCIEHPNLAGQLNLILNKVLIILTGQNSFVFSSSFVSIIAIWEMFLVLQTIWKFCSKTIFDRHWGFIVYHRCVSSMSDVFSFGIYPKTVEENVPFLKKIFFFIFLCVHLFPIILICSLLYYGVTGVSTLLFYSSFFYYYYFF